MSYETNNHSDRERDNEPLYSKRLKAGKRRTYFFDVRTTRGNDYFLTITESKKRFNDDGYDRHKIFLYKEDFNKFISALTDAVDHVKTELLPDFDFDSFSHDDYDQESGESHSQTHAHTAHTEHAHAGEQPADEHVAEKAEQNAEEQVEEKVEETVSDSGEPVESTSEVSSGDDLDMDVDKW